MLRSKCLPGGFFRATGTSRKCISTSSSSSSQGPNAPLDLDPSFQELLKDAEMSLLKFKTADGALPPPSPMRELEILGSSSLDSPPLSDNDGLDVGQDRKSARARFGTNKIGSVSLPLELQNAIQRVIDGGDKPRLHDDAKRLFQDPNGTSWHTAYNVKYRSQQQAERHATRDGTAFASIALPAHFSVIVAVLREVKHRLGPGWNVSRVLDWGSGVGSGLWASLLAFQSPPLPHMRMESDAPLMAQSTVSSYRSFEKRDGLSSMARRVLDGVKLGSRELRWGRGLPSSEFKEDPDANAVAMSAFHLSSLPDIAARKEILKQMWHSGADVVILIDHDTPSGFSCIAEARESILNMGNFEREHLKSSRDQQQLGCHIIAPCPHDQACPLRTAGSSNLKCTFSQRFQRPSFVRKTKHAGAGHEDLGYSYVVIKRGQRPNATRLDSKINSRDSAENETEDRIRVEAYDWPRMVFPPLKRSGHVVIDGCTAGGNIERITIPKSQGKQAYYDARKSSWGDIFPHKPKNPPQVRVKNNAQGSHAFQAPGSDIGKRGPIHTNQSTSYRQIIAELKEGRRERQHRVRD